MKVIVEYSVIADVGNSLLQLLREEMVPDPIPHPELIALASPADKGDLNLTLFLYHLTEYGELRNTPLLSRGTQGLGPPPLAVQLYFLLTAHSSAELHSKGLDEARILGKVMQVFYDNAILRGSQLQGVLADNDDELRLNLHMKPIEVMTRIWNFPNVPYKMSLSYQVGPVHIHSNRLSNISRVISRG